MAGSSGFGFSASFIAELSSGVEPSLTAKCLVKKPVALFPVMPWRHGSLISRTIHAQRRLYAAGAGFCRCQSSGNHWPIWLIGVAGRFVSSCVRVTLGIDGVPAAGAGKAAVDRGGLATALVCDPVAKGFPPTFLVIDSQFCYCLMTRCFG
jgi:hypothetical protein